MINSEKNAALTRRSMQWNESWQQPDMNAFWLDAALPSEVKDLFTNGWLQAQDRILDVGCGDGRIARGLSALGYDVVGVDGSHAAIRTAQKLSWDSGETTTFRVYNICSGSGCLGEFHAVLDRGCLHCIPELCHPDYFAGTARQLAPKGRLCILHKLDEATAHEVTERLTQAAEPYFKYETIEHTEITGNGKSLPALAILMTKVSGPR